MEKELKKAFVWLLGPKAFREKCTDLAGGRNISSRVSRLECELKRRAELEDILRMDQNRMK